MGLTIDNENLFRQAITDAVNLFVGAGFSLLAKDAIVSQPLEICERVSEYGCVEKYFSNPRWSVKYADIIQRNESERLGLVADVEVKYNE